MCNIGIPAFTGLFIFWKFGKLWWKFQLLVMGSFWMYVIMKLQCPGSYQICHTAWLKKLGNSRDLWRFQFIFEDEPLSFIENYWRAKLWHSNFYQDINYKMQLADNHLYHAWNKGRVTWNDRPYAIDYFTYYNEETTCSL